MTPLPIDAADVAAILGGGEVTDLARMLGGASRETWSFSYDGRPLVLRRDPPGSPRAGGLAREAELMTAARTAGVPVPGIVTAEPGRLVMTRLYGETLARRILRDDIYAGARAVLLPQCADALARLHRDVDVAGLPEQPDPVAALRESLDQVGDPYPVFELALARLDRSRANSHEPCVVHGDFRLGNLMIDVSGLVGVLDWELAHRGDPAEDLGWLCVRSWRFGGPLPVAGVGTREQLLAAYRDAGGVAVTADELAWWELYGTVRWGVICVQQAALHRSGAVRSVELAAIGRRTAEVALDVLELLAPEVVEAMLRHRDADQPAAAADPYDRPSGGELLDATGEWLDGLGLSGPAAFEARVVHRLLALVARELQLGPALAASREQRLDRLGVTNEAALATQLRAGRDGPEIVGALVADAVDRLRIADPAQLER